VPARDVTRAASTFAAVRRAQRARTVYGIGKSLPALQAFYIAFELLVIYLQPRDLVILDEIHTMNMIEGSLQFPYPDFVRN